MQDQTPNHETYYAQYVVINDTTGTVVWHESYAVAVEMQHIVGGIIVNTATTDPNLVKDLLSSARKNFNSHE